MCGGGDLPRVSRTWTDLYAVSALKQQQQQKQEQRVEEVNFREHCPEPTSQLHHYLQMEVRTSPFILRFIKSSPEQKGNEIIMQREPKEHKSKWSVIIRQGSRRGELVAFNKTGA